MTGQLNIKRIIQLPRIGHFIHCIEGGIILPIFLSSCGGNIIQGTSSVSSTVKIITQPTSATVALGQSAKFVAVATSTTDTTELHYQWRKNTVNIAGAISSSYLTPPTTLSDNKSSFDVVVSNGVESIDSDSALLTVAPATPPSIILQPQNQHITLGQTATFSVSATGTEPFNYQWLKNSVYIEGATSSIYTTPPSTIADNGSSYSVVLSNIAQSVTSDPATLTVSSPTQTRYYVATNGNDNADGSESSPFATLRRAQLAMQQSTIKATQIKAGTYYLTTPLVLTELDQQETWEAAPGATVILSGGEVLHGWTNVTSGLYSTNVKSAVMDLTVSGVREMPSDLGYDSDRPYTSGWRVLEPNQAQSYGSTFSVLPSDLTASVKPGAIVQVIDYLRWNDQFTKIVSVDTANHTVTVANSFNTGTVSGVTGSWRVLYDPEDLDAVGEFAYDAATSKVYLRPSEAQNLASETVVAARLGTLISLNNVSGITISGLTFSDTTSTSSQSFAIMGNNLDNSIISGNLFLNVGSGIRLSKSSNNIITENTFKSVGIYGISLAENSNYNRISSNSLKDIGHIHALSCGISVGSSAFNLIDSNLIDGVGRWGINLGSKDNISFVDNVISNNLVINTSRQTSDSGAIYFYAGNITGYLTGNTTITGNRIENVGGLIRDGNGNYKAGSARGIYMDDHASDVSITNNVIDSGAEEGVYVCHGCKNNSATNNLIVLQPAALYDRKSHGTTFSTGNMTYKGTTRVDLLPSYFPTDVSTSTIVVQLSGHSYEGLSATFNVLADGVVIGSGIASDVINDFIFKAALTPHQVHQIGITLTNGADTGIPTTALHNLVLFVNNTAVNLVAPEANGKIGSEGFAAGSDDLMVTNFSITHNIVYRNGGLSQNLGDSTSQLYPSYVDTNPGSVDFNILHKNITKSIDSIFGSQSLDINSLLVDPLFTNPSEGNYTLQSKSPAFTAGFRTNNVPLAPYGFGE